MGVEVRVSISLQEKGPMAVKVWSFLKLLGDFGDFLDEVTHFIAKIPKSKDLLLDGKMGTKFIEKGVRGIEKVSLSERDHNGKSGGLFLLGVWSE